MRKINKCKLCGGTGNIRYEIEYDCTAVKPCPTCCQPEAQTEQKDSEICSDPRCVQSTECDCDNPMRCDCVIGCRCEYICNHCRKVVNKWHNCRKHPQPTDGLYQKKPVVGWEDYSVDTLGKVWSTKKGVEKELSPSSINGYQRVYLSQAGKSVSFFVHRLVLETFVGSCPIGQQTCHNNGVRADNRLVNLRWDTPSSNQADRIKHGTFQCGEAASNARLTEKEVKEIWELHLKGVPLIEIVKDYPHVTVYAIQKIVEGINWKHLNPKKDG